MDQKTDDLGEQSGSRVGKATSIILILGVIFFIALLYGCLSNHANAGARGARILVISALADKTTAIEAIKRGTTGFLLKPFTAETLTTEIAELFIE